MRPIWLDLYDELANPIILIAKETIQNHTFDDINLMSIPLCALIHLGTSLEMSNGSNKRGYHSVAASLLRSAVETLTLIDIGLQPEEYARPLLEAWKDGRKTQGALRAELERSVWPRYGKGLWDESWIDFFSQLARAVQPYAHFTNNLMLWCYKMEVPGQTIKATSQGVKLLTTVEPTTFDSQKARQIATLEGLMIWTLGRLLVMNRNEPQIRLIATKIEMFGKALADSEFISGIHDWSTNLLPIMFSWSDVQWGDYSDVETDK